MLVWSYLKRYKKLLGFALLFAALNQIFSLLDPLIFRFVVDDFISVPQNYSRPEFLVGIAKLLLLMVAVAFISRLAKNIQEYYVSAVSQHVGTAMYADSVDHTFSLPYELFEDRQSGELLQKMQRARDDAKKLIEQTIGLIFVSAVGMLFVLIYVFFIHWSVFALFAITLPLIGFFTMRISKRIKKAQTEIVRESSELSGQTTETIRNVELVKSLGLEKQEIARLNAVNDKILDLELKKIKQIRTLNFIQGTIVNALRTLLLFLMGYLVYAQVMSVGQFFTVMFYSFFIFSPLQSLGTFAASLQEAKASAKELQDILSLPPQKQPENPVVVGTIEDISFSDVCFRYADQATIQHVSFSLNKGKTYAFVGPSGSGKSTLVKLLVGLYRPQQGTITVNGISQENISYPDLRKRIGFVAQETQLFAGTIRENLLFVQPNATDSQCKEVLRMASVDHLLSRSKKGLSTTIGEGGIKLSGGEKQRLAIARALLRQPDLIIFDEATSSLDSLTENEITQTIKSINQHKPDLLVVLIAHRLSTVEHADIIFVVNEGKIEESGTHRSLLRKHGLYDALWQQQH